VPTEEAVSADGCVLPGVLSVPERPRPLVVAVLRTAEESVAATALLLMAALPIAELVARPLLGAGIRGSTIFVQHLTLWVALLGAALAAREGRLLALATSTYLPEGLARRAAGAFAGSLGAAVATLLVFGGLQLVRSEREAATTLVLDLPAWVSQLILPVAFALVALRLVWRAGTTWRIRAAALTGVIAAVAVVAFPGVIGGAGLPVGLGILLAGAALGAPLFALLGGAAVLLFMSDGITPVAVLIETYALSVKATLPAIPLFTLAGFLLAEGHASLRLLRVFRAFFGWLPGGTAVVCTVLCAFFTTFTGGSGVTILALGGLLYPALLRDGYRERFSLGLLTASGSLGLLLPPALPLILYGIVAGTSIEDLFIGGLLPGLLFIILMAALGVRESVVSGTSRQPFCFREALTALWAAKWEALLPVVVLAAIFGGFTTTVEAAALTALYAFVVQVAVRREIAPGAHLLRVLTACIVTVGGVLMILGVAVGFTAYLLQIDAPGRLLAWTQQYVHSPYVFLLGLNVFLLIVGCLMDIFSAIFVVVPLIVPLGAAFGVHPVHLGIIFVANLELGYLTPPVGLNLFLSSYRFHRPLLSVARAVLPMLAILGVGVLVVTYVPWLTTGLLAWLGGD
jgi:tripartite ATP-independent transporter DctM subunit